MLADRHRVALETSRERFARAAVMFPVLDCWILFSDEQNLDLFEDAYKYPHRREFGQTVVSSDYTMSAAFTTNARIDTAIWPELAAAMRPAGDVALSITWHGDDWLLRRKWGDGDYEWLAFLADRQFRDGQLQRWIPFRGPQSNSSISWDALRLGTFPLDIGGRGTFPPEDGDWHGVAGQRIRKWIGNPPDFFEFVIRDVLTASINACDWLLKHSAELRSVKPSGDHLHAPSSTEILPNTTENDADSTATTTDPEPFSGGQMIFFPDRVELCGVEICNNGRRLERRRKALDLLRVQRKDGQFESYSCKKLADKIGIEEGEASAAALIRQTRKRISEVLRNKANIDCGDQDVIVSTDHGYRFSEKLTVQFGDQPNQGHGSDPTCSNVPNVPNDRDGDVPNVRDSTPASRREWILKRLDEGHELQAPAVAKQFSCHLKTAKRDLTALVAEAKIEYVGPRRTGHYRRPKPPGDGTVIMP